MAKNWKNASRDEQLAKKARVWQPKNDDELYEWCKFFWGFTLPRKCSDFCAKKAIPCTAPFKVFADAYFARYPLIILKGARGCGKSATLAALSLTEQVNLNVEVLILAGSKQQSEVVFNYIKPDNLRMAGLFWQHPNAPTALINQDKQLMTETKVIDGGFIRCLSASETSVLGKRPTRFRIDEVDKVDLELVDHALLCPRPLGNIKDNTLLSSTHYDPDGTMTKLIERYTAINEEAGEVLVPIYQYCYRDVHEDNGGFVTEETIRKLRMTIPPHVWERQMENGEPVSDDAIFTQDQIDYMFDSKLGVFAGNIRDNNDINIDEKFYQNAEKFYHGADWARKKDWTILTSMATIPGENDSEPEKDILVSWRRLGRCDWSYMINEYDKLIKAHQGPAAHDGTGCSDHVEEYLEESSTPVSFQNRKLIHETLTKLIAAIQNKQIKCPYIDYLKKEFQGLTYDQAFGKEHLPDGVASMAMAWYARNSVISRLNFHY